VLDIMKAGDFTLNARDGNIRYSPPREDPAEQGWGYADDDFGTMNSSIVGAKIEIDWVGTAVKLYGTGQPSAYRLTLNGSSPIDQPTADGVLGEYSGLENWNHTVTLEIVQGSSEVTFSRVSLTFQLGEDRCAANLP
jgi:hypothetical protein